MVTSLYVELFLPLHVGITYLLFSMFFQPHSPDNRALARECKDVKIDRVYIGSCTGGKTEDFMAAAKLFHAAVSYTCFSVTCVQNNLLSWVLNLRQSLQQIDYLTQDK